jgi:hypothetical protein
MVTLFRFAVFVALLTTTAASAFAKLPPPTDEQKASAAEAAAKTAWSDKVDLYKLCLAQDKVAQSYRARAQGTTQGTTKAAPAPVSTEPCVNPGPYAAVTPTASKPSEASGAHSPPGLAVSPPSTNTPAAASAQAKK